MWSQRVDFKSTESSARCLVFCIQREVFVMRRPFHFECSPLVEAHHGLHVFITQLEVKQLEVLLDPMGRR